jgi:ERF superfamily protein
MPDTLGVEADESKELDKLAAALAKAQGTITNAPKDHTAKVKMKDNKGEYKYRYATLDGIWDAARAALSANELAVIQCPTLTAEGVLLTTTLLHSSGQFVRTRLLWPVHERTAQGIGSAITYARRYSLAPLVGVVTEEDDDASAADGREADTSAPEESAPTTFPPFGKGKGQPIAGAAVDELRWYEARMHESIADPEKARYQGKNKAMLAAIEAELARQRGAAKPEGQRETKSGPAVDVYEEAAKMIQSADSMGRVSAVLRRAFDSGRLNADQRKALDGLADRKVQSLKAPPGDGGDEDHEARAANTDDAPF